MPTAYLEPLPDLGTTLVRIPTLNAGWRAGQFVRLRVLSRGMGWYAWSEAHPYTIASACEGPGGGEMVFMIKKCGLWTRKLYDIASAPADDDEKSERTVRVLVEGPYGACKRFCKRARLICVCTRRTRLYDVFEFLGRALHLRRERHLVWPVCGAGDPATYRAGNLQRSYRRACLVRRRRS